MDDELITRLLESENLKEELNKLSFDERYFILRENVFLTKTLLDRIFSENILLFNREESLEILYNCLYLYRDALDKRPNINSKLLDLTDEDFIKYYFETGSLEALRFIENGELIFKNIDKFKRGVLPLVFQYLRDEDLATLIVQKKYIEYIPQIMHSFKEDKYKIRFLNKMPRSGVTSVICSMSEENIRKYISFFARQKGLLISKLSSDEEKEKYLEQYQLVLTSEDKANIVSSFSNKKYIRKNIKYLITETALYLFIVKILKDKPSVFKEDLNYYLKAVNSIKNDYFLSRIIIGAIPNLEDANIIIEYIDKIKNPRNLYDIFCAAKSEELIDYILNKMSQKYIYKYIKDNSDYLKVWKALTKLRDNRLFFQALRNFTFKYKYSENMLPIFERVSKEYRLNLDHLIKIAKLTNCSILSQVTNPNIMNAINLDDKSFEKYMKIFDKSSREMTNNSMSSVLNSLLNSKFAFKFPKEVQIFSETLHAIDDGEIDKAVEKIKKVIYTLGFSSIDIDYHAFIAGVLNKDAKILELYNKMTYEYLIIKKNNYVKDNMDAELDKAAAPLYNVNDLVKYMFRILSAEELYEIIRKESGNYDESEYSEILQDDDLLKKLINFKKNPSAGISPEIKKYIRNFNNLLALVFSSNEYRRAYYKLDELRIERDFSKYDRSFLIEIMSELNPIKLKELLFNDEELYNDLLKHLSCYGVLGWGNRFKTLADEADVDMAPDIIASLISNFRLIRDEKKRKEKAGESFTFISELSFAECLSSDALIYQNIFGRENYRFLRRNPFPNRSPEVKKVRLVKATEFLKVMHNRKYITVPPVNKNFKLQSGRTLNIVIGDTNNPINLTYGERTGACMRIGGAGYSLFKFCLKSENGFHISFNDPETGELVSRVSCYRNGNTVFFNQVRISLSSKYNNKDIQNAAVLIGKEIIELTKSSKYPVVNVVTSPSVAFEDSQTVNMHCNNPTLGFASRIYTDIKSNVVVLATRGKHLSKIALGPNNCEKYEVGRTPIRKYFGEKASTEIARVEAVDEFFDGVAVNNIKVKLKKIKYAYVGEDWYVAITSDNKVINYVEKNSRNPKKAKEEMNKYLSTIKEDLKYKEMGYKRKAK